MEWSVEWCVVYGTRRVCLIHRPLSISSSHSFSLSTGGRKSAPNSKLASIFAQEPDYSVGTASLGYKGSRPPVKSGPLPTMQQQTQPQPTGASSQSASSEKQALHQSLITLIRYDAARVGTVVGQRALALMKHPASGGHVLVCYDHTDPNKRDLMLQVNDSFAFMPQAPVYGFLYDEQKNYWCLQLANGEVLQDLARAIGLAKGSASHTTGGVSVVTQDLFVNAAEARAISNGDAVKLRLNLYNFLPGRELGTPLTVVGSEEKPKQLKLGGGKDIAGLEQGLVGMKKGGKRLMIVPPSLGYGAAGNAAFNVQPNTWIALEVELLKVKFADKPQAALMPGTPSSAPSSQVSPARPVAAVGGAAIDFDEGVAAANGASASDGGEQSDSRRGSLASRMAALGGFAMPTLVPSMANVLHTPSAGGNTPAPTQPMTHATSNPAGETDDAAAHAVSPPMQQPTLTHTNSQQTHFQPGQQAPHDVHAGLTSPPQQHQHQQQQLQQPMQQQQQPPVQQQPTQYSQHQHQPMQQFPQHNQMPGQSQVGYNSFYPQQPQPSPSHLQSYPGAPVQQPSSSIYPPGPVGYGSQQFGPGGVSVGGGGGGGVGVGPVPPAHFFHSLDSKLDHIQSQLGRCIGSTNAYDPHPTLTGQQMIKGLTSLIAERDEQKAKADKASEQVLELQAKLSALHERNESYLAENTKLSEARFQNYADEMKLKNATLAELQESLRHSQSETREKTQTLQEAEFKLQRMQVELDLARGEVNGKKELEKNIVLLQVQVDELKKSHTLVGEEVKATMSADIARLTQELSQKETELSDMRSKVDQAARDGEEATARVQRSLSELDSTHTALQKAHDTLRAELEEARSQTREKDDELARVHLQLERTREEGLGSAKEVESAAARERQQMQQRIETLETELSQLQAERQSFEESMLARIDESQRAHQEALVAARGAGSEEGAAQVSQEWKTKLEDVVAKAKMKIEHLQSELDQLQQDKNELSSQLAAVSDEKQQVLDQSKSIIAKIRTQVQEQQARHEEELQAAHAATEAALAQVTSNGMNGVNADGTDWREKVKKSMQTLYQTLAASLQESEEDSYTRLQIRDLLVKDIKQVTIRMLQGETDSSEGEPEATSETAESESTTVAPTEASTEETSQETEPIESESVATEPESITAVETEVPSSQEEPATEPAGVESEQAHVEESTSTEAPASEEHPPESVAQPTVDAQLESDSAVESIGDAASVTPSSSSAPTSKSAKKNAKKAAKKKAARKLSHTEEEKSEDIANEDELTESSEKTSDDATYVVVDSPATTSQEQQSEPASESKVESADETVPASASQEDAQHESISTEAAEPSAPSTEAGEGESGPSFVADPETEAETATESAPSTIATVDGEPIESSHSMSDIDGSSVDGSSFDMPSGRSRTGAITLTEPPTTASSTTPTPRTTVTTMNDPFDDSGDAFANPSTTSAPQPSPPAAAPPKPKAASLFGDDDDGQY